MGNSTTNGNFAMLVRRSTGAIGATKLLKVMAGDRIHTMVDYYYTQITANNSGTTTLQRAGMLFTEEESKVVSSILERRKLTTAV